MAAVGGASVVARAGHESIEVSRVVIVYREKVARVMKDGSTDS